MLKALTLKGLWPALGVVGAALAFTGCDPCREFRNDPTKYDFYKSPDDDKPTKKEPGPFVIAVYCKGSDRSAVREEIEKSMKEAGGGSLGDLKDDGGNYHNFGRWVPYGGENVPVSFETTFAAKDLNTDEPLELVWRGTSNERVLELNKIDNGNPVAGYPTVAETGGKFKLKVPGEYAGDKKKMLIAMTKLEERTSGGYKFRALPFTIRSKAKGAEVPLTWDGAGDLIKPELEAIEFFTVTGFKGDPRDLNCHLLRTTRVAANGANLEFDLALSTLWFKVTGRSASAFKVFDAGGEITGESGQVVSVEAKLPDGYPNPGKKYENKQALEDAQDKQPGDYYIKSDSDEQQSKVTYRLYIRIPVKKDSTDPDRVDFKITVKSGTGTKDYNETWKAGK